VSHYGNPRPARRTRTWNIVSHGQQQQRQ